MSRHKSFQSEPSVECRIAVIVTVYNKAPYVRACLESLMAQTCPAFELVVVDDGSTDGSWEVVETVAGGTGAQLLRLENGGVSRARNLGFTACRTNPQYLMFLDGDDVLLPDGLRTLLAHMERHGAVSMCYSVPMLIDADGVELGVDTDQVRWVATGLGRRELPDDELETPIEAIWAHFRAMPSACMVRRSAYEKTSGWDDSLCRPARPFQVEDKDMAIQLALVGPVHRIPTRTFQYRVLPTAHRQSLYDGLREIDRKWWNARVDPRVRRTVRRAIRFDSRVVVLDAARELLSTLRPGSFGKTLPASINLMRAMVRLASLPGRLTRLA